MKNTQNTNKQVYHYFTIKIKANEHIRVDEICSNIKKNIPSNISCSIIHLPKRTYKLSVLASPHAYSTTRNTLAFDDFKACIMIGKENKMTDEDLKKLLLTINTNVKFIAGVFTKVTRCTKTA